MLISLTKFRISHQRFHFSLAQSPISLRQSHISLQQPFISLFWQFITILIIHKTPKQKTKTNSIRSSRPAHPFAVRHICKPPRAVAPSKGLQKSLSARPTPTHQETAALRLKSLRIFDKKMTKNKKGQLLTHGIVHAGFSGLRAFVARKKVGVNWQEIAS